MLSYEVDRPVDKKWDIGYRASKLPYWFGSLGQIKYRLANEVAEALMGYGLIINSSVDPADLLYGEDWYLFLSRSKAVLGSESGSSLVIRDKATKRKIQEYLKDNPEAKFEEVNKNVLDDMDGQLYLSSVSPRHFECAALKVCQLLVEGEYDGVMQPDKHYIPIKKDFSNLEEVVEKLKDDKYCSRIVESCYKDVAKNAKYSYRAYSESVVESMVCNQTQKSNGQKSPRLIFVRVRVAAGSIRNFFRVSAFRALAGKVIRQNFPSLYATLRKNNQTFC